MKTSRDTELQELLEATHSRPSISIILPFEPKMTAKNDISNQLKSAVARAQLEVEKKYNNEMGRLVLDKLRRLVASLNFTTYKRSVAIYVSPFFEKVLYLDIAMEPKVIVDGSFEIRDVLYAKKDIRQFMLLVLSGQQSKVYIGDTNCLTKVKTDGPDHIAAFKTDLPERVGNFTDATTVKQVLIEKFLRHTDEGLSWLLQAYHLPVFVTGAEKINGIFRQITRHEKYIISYIHGNYIEANTSELEKVLRPHLEDWKKVKTQDLKHQLQAAADCGKLATGIHEVLKQANRHNSRLLVVEKDFLMPSGDAPGKNYNRFSYVKDQVDDVIEKVLEAGGDVEFVDNGMLGEYQHISLIERYS